MQVPVLVLHWRKLYLCIIPWAIAGTPIVTLTMEIGKTKTFKKSGMEEYCVYYVYK